MRSQFVAVLQFLWWSLLAKISESACPSSFGTGISAARKSAAVGGDLNAVFDVEGAYGDFVGGGPVRLDSGMSSHPGGGVLSGTS